ncbi:flavin reductase family protein [Hyphomonas sp. FCG-A18]|jgi:3-hydroxy-9,10-secoandrosta-1,3,5(10)-triene-9,17-dione monooxygenase reductase component|uniref:flavin reductase family protein n=1 Tax=Hyphomonas sp. FCG-A18 TaxID=3080019 RepID=UPI002B2F9004|nr:flavin reductase family protein [Hyphomonas sp. FCG-A18]
MSFDQRVLRDALGLFVTGVTVITTKGIDGESVGLTANSFNSVSLDPPLVLWSIGTRSKSLPAFAQADHFAVHILGENQIELSQRFARSGADKFASLPVTKGIGDVPLLEGCAARLECSIYDRHAAGDHVIYLGEVQRLVHNQNARPLVYHGGQYAELADKWPEPTNS